MARQFRLVQRMLNKENEAKTRVRHSTMPLANPDIPADWGLTPPEHPHSKKINDVLGGQARRLAKLLRETPDKEKRKQAVYGFYRKYYTLTLCKSCVEVGVNSNPARDRILDFPWKDLEENRIICRQLWEKINK